MTQNTQLQQAVLDELNWEPSVTAGHIGVAANDGVVTLTGHVTGFLEKHAAERAAGRVKGVKAIVEEIDVKLPFDKTRDDALIAKDAVQHLASSLAFPTGAVKVTVENGWITLKGEVASQYQRQLAKEDVERISGVVGVSNVISIKSTVNTANIEKDIQKALNRMWFYEPNDVKVTAKGGKVHLTGTVRSWYDCQLSAATAWAAPGVTDVSNDISIMS